MGRVIIFEYDPSKDEAYECGFAPSAKDAVFLLLPGANIDILMSMPGVKWAAKKVDEDTREIYISKLEVGKPVRFHWTLEGLRAEYGL